MPVSGSHVIWQLGLLNVSHANPAGQSAAVMHAPAGSACVRPKNDGSVTLLLLLLLLKGLTAAVASKPVEEHMLKCIRVSCCCCCCCCSWLGNCAVAFAVLLLLTCTAVALPPAAAAAAAVALLLAATAPAASLLLLLPGALQPAWHMPSRAHNAPGRCSSPGLLAVSATICSHPGKICCSKVGSVPIAVDRQKPCKKHIQNIAYQHTVVSNDAAAVQVWIRAHCCGQAKALHVCEEYGVGQMLTP
jgi:hypothetical protein